MRRRPKRSFTCRRGRCARSTAVRDVGAALGAVLYSPGHLAARRRAAARQLLAGRHRDGVLPRGRDRRPRPRRRRGPRRRAADARARARRRGRDARSRPARVRARPQPRAPRSAAAPLGPARRRARRRRAAEDRRALRGPPPERHRRRRSAAATARCGRCRSSRAPTSRCARAGCGALLAARRDDRHLPRARAERARRRHRPVGAVGAAALARLHDLRHRRRARHHRRPREHPRAAIPTARRSAAPVWEYVREDPVFKPRAAPDAVHRGVRRRGRRRAAPRARRQRDRRPAARDAAGPRQRPARQDRHPSRARRRGRRRPRRLARGVDERAGRDPGGRVRRRHQRDARRPADERAQAARAVGASARSRGPRRSACCTPSTRSSPCSKRRMLEADALVAIAERANPRRSFLLVSSVLGKHLPVRRGALPARRHSRSGCASRATRAPSRRPRRAGGARRAARARSCSTRSSSAPATLAPDAVVLGFAETATALGEQVASIARRGVVSDDDAPAQRAAPTPSPFEECALARPRAVDRRPRRRLAGRPARHRRRRADDGRHGRAPRSRCCTRASRATATSSPRSSTGAPDDGDGPLERCARAPATRASTSSACSGAARAGARSRAGAAARCPAAGDGAAGRARAAASCASASPDRCSTTARPAPARRALAAAARRRRRRDRAAAARQPRARHRRAPRLRPALRRSRRAR